MITDIIYYVQNGGDNIIYYYYYVYMLQWHYILVGSDRHNKNDI